MKKNRRKILKLDKETLFTLESGDLLTFKAGAAICTIGGQEPTATTDPVTALFCHGCP